MNALQIAVTQRLSKEGINSAFFTACLSELLIGYYNTYSNEAKDIIKKLTIDDFKLPEKANRSQRRVIEKKLEKDKEAQLEAFKKFETSIITFLRMMDTLDDKTRKTLENIQNQVFEQLTVN